MRKFEANGRLYRKARVARAKKREIQKAFLNSLFFGSPIPRYFRNKAGYFRSPNQRHL